MPLEEVPVDQTEFTQWLESQPALVGTARHRINGRLGRTMVAATGLLGAAALRFGSNAQDNSPIAQYLSGMLGRPVVVVDGVVEYWNMEKVGRLPAWAAAFDRQVNARPGKPISRTDALAVLAALP